MDSFWGTFWTLLIFIPLLLLWVFALVDLFRNPDLSGLTKALWAIAIVLLPIIGMLVYFIAVYPVGDAAAAAPVDVTSQLSQLGDLHDQGVLSDEEFQREKDKLLGVEAAPPE